MYILTEVWFANTHCFVTYFCELFIVCNEFFLANITSNSLISFFRSRVHNRKVETISLFSPAPSLPSTSFFHQLKHWMILVERRQFNEERNVSCFLSIIICFNMKNLSWICNCVRTKERFNKLGSSLWHNFAFAHIDKFVCRITYRG